MGILLDTNGTFLVKVGLMVALAAGEIKFSVDNIYI